MKKAKAGKVGSFGDGAKKVMLVGESPHFWFMEVLQVGGSVV